MPIFELTQKSIVEIKRTTLASQGIREKEDLQRLLRENIGVLDQGLYVVAEEYKNWEDSKRSIDLLCIDKEANLVVVELKRTEDGGHMELQALRYAAMISKMTYADAVEANSKFLSSIGKPQDGAASEILSFLDWDEPSPDFGRNVRIVLVSADFSKEITTAVIWLNERDIDIRCIRVRPHQLDNRTLLDVQQVLPLPEAAEYQIRLKQKAAEERQQSQSGSDWTRFNLKIGEQKFENLFKRRLFFLVIQKIFQSGASLQTLNGFFLRNKFLNLPGKLDGEAFEEAATKVVLKSGSSPNLRRYYANASDLIFTNGETVAISNQWAADHLPSLDRLIESHPELEISYERAPEDISDDQ